MNSKLDLMNANHAQTALGKKLRTTKLLMQCSLCGKIYFDEENVNFIENYGGCLSCDHIQGEVYAGLNETN